MTTVPSALARAAAGRVAPAGDADAVLGVRPDWVASPTSTGEVSDVLSWARAHDVAVLPRGGGSKLGWGDAPGRAGLVLDTLGLVSPWEHAAGDLVVTTGAGELLSTIQSRLRDAGQRLSLDPARSGTIGGAVATATSGPLRLRAGAARDLVIGMTFVRADGVVAHSGGKVVKNVAGYDLAKLLTGSFGTLGVITELTLRLHPLPQRQLWVGAGVEGRSAVHTVVQALVGSQLMPAAVELDWVDGVGHVWVQLDGPAEALDLAARHTKELLHGPGTGEVSAEEEPPPWWGAEPEVAGPLLKVTHEIGTVDAVLAAVDRAAEVSGASMRLRGSPGVGTALVGWVRAPAAAEFATALSLLRQEVSRLSGSVVVLEADPQLRAGVDVWGPVQGLQLMEAVKAQFDPGQLLSPGRFVGGI